MVELVHTSGVTIRAGNQLSYILIYNSLPFGRVTSVQRGPLIHTFAEYHPRVGSLIFLSCEVSFSFILSFPKSPSPGNMSKNSYPSPPATSCKMD